MKQKLGLVMEGGAMRGLFTAGVIDVFMEHAIRTDGVIGVSAGATFGCNYLTQQKGRPLRYCIRFCRDPRFCSVPSLLLTGDMPKAELAAALTALAEKQAICGCGTLIRIEKDEN